MTYITKQQRAVLSSLEGCWEGVGAVELSELLHRRGESVGLTTVYRQLEKLEQRGLVHKIVTDEGARYRYCESGGQGCFLLKCEVCGAVEHADCTHLGELYSHLAAEHRFRINPRRTLFYGICSRCAQEADV